MLFRIKTVYVSYENETRKLIEPMKTQTEDDYKRGIEKEKMK